MSGARTGGPGKGGGAVWQPAVVESLPDAVLVVDGEGRIRYANAAAADIFGYSASELTGLGVEALVPSGMAEAHSRHRKGFMAAPATRPMRSGVRFPGVRKDGTSLALEIMLDHAPGPDGDPLVICIVRDVTDRARHEAEAARANRALRVLSAGNTSLVKSRSERELVERVCRAAVEAGGYQMAWIGWIDRGGEGSLRVLAKAGNEHGYIQETRPFWVNPQATGSPVARALVTGKAVYEREIDGAARGQDWREGALRRGFRSIAAFPLHDGERVAGCFAIYSSQPGAFDWKEADLLSEMAEDLAFGLRNMKERADHEAEISRITDMLTTAQRIGKVGSWDWDIVADDAVWSDEMASIFGFEPGAGGGDLSRALELMHPDDKQRVADAVATALDGGAPYEIRYRIVRPDGELRHIYAVGEVIRDAMGKPVRMIGSVQDVTAEHFNEQMREQMLDVVSHTLRTPVTVIQGYASLLATAEDRLPKKQLEEIQGRIETASLQLAVLMTSVTELVKLREDESPPPLETMGVQGVLDDALQIVEIKNPAWRSRIRVGVDVGAERIQTGRRRLSLALERVVDNALRYSPPDAPVELHASPGARGRAVIAVADRGPGIAPEVVSSLGKPFTRAEVHAAHSVGGAGLGLSMAARLTRSIGAEIRVVPRPGGGTVVSFDVPKPPGR